MERKGSPGIAVDASGGAVIDPTANVLDLVDAAVKRQDDLRGASERYVEARLQHLEDMASLRAEHAKEIRDLDTKRLDATRAVDISAGATEAKRSLDAIQTLATQTLNTASTIATSNAEIVTAMTARIAALEKSSYEGAGKDAGPSAQTKEIIAAISALALKDSSRTGGGEGIRQLMGYIITAASLALAAAAFFAK
jgi:hypothetical protein